MRSFEPRQRFLLGALALGHLSNDWVAGTLWLLAPAIAASLGLGPAEVGLILAVNGIGAGLAYIPAGICSDRSSRPGLLMLLSFWWVALGYLSATLVPGFWAITLLLAVGVMGDAFWHPVATGTLVKAMPGRRAQVLGIHAIGGSIGAEVLAPLSTGFLLGYFEWQTALQILLLPVVAMGILFIPVAFRIGREHPGQAQRIDFIGMARDWARPTGLALIAMMILYNMALIAQLAMAPLYFQQIHRLSPFHAGAIFAVILVVGSLLQPWLGKWSDTRERKPLVLILLFAAAFFALFAGLADSLTWALLGLLPSIAILTGVRPVILAAAVEYSGKSEATTLGVVFTVLDGVGMAGALAAGIAGEIELAYAFLLGAVLAFAAGLFCIFLKFPRGIVADEPSISPVASPADP